MCCTRPWMSSFGRNKTHRARVAFPCPVSFTSFSGFRICSSFYAEWQWLSGPCFSGSPPSGSDTSPRFKKSFPCTSYPGKAKSADCSSSMRRPQTSHGANAVARNISISPLKINQMPITVMSLPSSKRAQSLVNWMWGLGARGPGFSPIWQWTSNFASRSPRLFYRLFAKMMLPALTPNTIPSSRI